MSDRIPIESEKKNRPHDAASPRRSIRRRLSFVLGLLVSTVCAVQTGAHAQQDRPSEYRSYTDGPLTPEDFEAPIPGFVKFPGQLAQTMTDFRYDFQYRLYHSSRRTMARLTSIRIQAVVVPAQSWNRQPKNRRLMDHEQGHFDLTYIAHLRARRRFAASRDLIGSGTNAESAVKDLRQKVDDRFDQLTEKLLAAHLKYDEVTRHGAAPGPQKEQRQLQKQEIEELTGGAKSDSPRGQAKRGGASSRNDE